MNTKIVEIVIAVIGLFILGSQVYTQHMFNEYIVDKDRLKVDTFDIEIKSNNSKIDNEYFLSNIQIDVKYLGSVANKKINLENAFFYIELNNFYNNPQLIQKDVYSFIDLKNTSNKKYVNALFVKENNSFAIYGNNSSIRTDETISLFYPLKLKKDKVYMIVFALNRNNKKSIQYKYQIITI